ncbi:hypothetical protein CYMTET_25920 [Cymbomonas tetramitiformis]|uniref:Uncharacterized protein n=1 Tax=Cymbomonas tetramitiformis TaxID=36881 RepID=A0AAE0FTF8_9CHLO|nr:hypothetical protein CYMTET_25920 [Cymbomonas tetramitiformis]
MDSLKLVQMMKVGLRRTKEKLKALNWNPKVYHQYDNAGPRQGKKKEHIMKVDAVFKSARENESEEDLSSEEEEADIEDAPVRHVANGKQRRSIGWQDKETARSEPSLLPLPTHTHNKSKNNSCKKSAAASSSTRQIASTACPRKNRAPTNAKIGKLCRVY